MKIDPQARTRMSVNETDALVGAEFAGYRIEERIGSGGMGTVYRATQLSLKRSVALKVLPEASTGDAQYLERFTREADALSRLNHPNIVTVYERGTHEGRPWVAMEHVEGTNLRTVMRSAPIPPAEALSIVRSVLAALEHAHAKGIVHRDIKPENVLLAPGGIVKVADFGLSRVLQPTIETRLTRTHMMLGTYEYMAPEQREHSRDADERSDLYATGVVLYELLAGELPIGAFAPLTRKCPWEHAGRLDAIVRRALDKDPDERYQRAGAMADAISEILDRDAVRELPSVSAASRTLAFDPLRFATRLDLLATFTTVLATLIALGGIAWFLAGAIEPEGMFYSSRLPYTLGFAVPVIGIAMLATFAFQTANGLRRFQPGARQANAILSFLALGGFFTAVYSLLSFLCLHTFRAKHYFDARARGLSAERAITSIHDAALGRPPEDGPELPARDAAGGWRSWVVTLVVGGLLAGLWGGAFEIAHEGRTLLSAEVFLAWIAVVGSVWAVAIQPRLFRLGRNGPLYATAAMLVFGALCTFVLFRLGAQLQLEYARLH